MLAGGLGLVADQLDFRAEGLAWGKHLHAPQLLASKTVRNPMECVTKCLETVLGPPSEFGPNLTAWSPLSLSQIRSRQEWNEQPESYKIGKDKGAVITLRYGWVCQRGLYPDDPDKENQDSFKIIPSFDGEPKTLLMGVFDGHGEYGDDCSAFVRDSIGDYLAAARKEYKKDLEKSFRASFRKMNSDMHFQTDFSDLLSGTTACVAFFEKSAVWVCTRPQSTHSAELKNSRCTLALPACFGLAPLQELHIPHISQPGEARLGLDTTDPNATPLTPCHLICGCTIAGCKRWRFTSDHCKDLGRRTKG